MTVYVYKQLNESTAFLVVDEELPMDIAALNIPEDQVLEFIGDMLSR